MKINYHKQSQKLTDIAMTQSQMNLYLADVQILTSEFHYVLRIMEFEGVRLGGRDDYRRRGIGHSLVNNHLASDSQTRLNLLFRTDYLKCLGQAEYLLKYLYQHRSSFNLEWRFTLAHKPGHYWVECIPVIDSRWENADHFSYEAFQHAASIPLAEEYKIVSLDPWREEIIMRNAITTDITVWYNGEERWYF